MPRSAPRERIAEYKSKCEEQNPTIEFVGVFDTVVGGHGLAAVAQKLRLSERNVPANVKNAVQLLAVDESRSFFRPIMWTGTSKTSTSLEQIWMPGVHSDVGGAYSNRHLGNIALLTMIDRIIASTSLQFELDLCARLNERNEMDLPKVHDEYSKAWRFFCPLPKARKVDATLTHQSVHPYAIWLDGQAVLWKGRKTTSTYILPKDVAELPVAEEFKSGNFNSFVR